MFFMVRGQIAHQFPLCIDQSGLFFKSRIALEKAINRPAFRPLSKTISIMQNPSISELNMVR